MGDCFETNSKLADRCKGVLCHGIVIGTGGKMLGLPFVHAWVEIDGGVVLDHSNSRAIEIPKELYYSTGQIDPGKVVRYTVQEMYREFLTHEHFGPWVKHLLEHI